jgi:predicted alpha/beta-hydrolase family hydrolase
LAEAADTLLLFAHGAGAGPSHPFMQSWSQRLSKLGRTVCFEYPYMSRGRRTPDRLPVLLEAHREALAQARGAAGERVVLAGKSMGARVGSHLALEEPVAALVCFGYPLVGGGKQPKLRDEVLLALEVPILFVQGSRDKLCPLELLDDVCKKMKAPHQVFVVEGGDHSLQVARRQLAQDGETQEQVDERIFEAVRCFLDAPEAAPSFAGRGA